jgi:cell division protein FtsN
VAGAIVIALGAWFAWSRIRPNAPQGVPAEPPPAANSEPAPSDEPPGSQSQAPEQAGGPGEAAAAVPPAAEVVPPPAESRPAQPRAIVFAIQVASFLTEEKARGYQQQLSRTTGRPGHVLKDEDSEWYRVAIGEYPNAAQATSDAERWIGDGLVEEAILITLPAQGLAQAR